MRPRQANTGQTPSPVRQGHGSGLRRRPPGPQRRLRCRRLAGSRRHPRRRAACSIPDAAAPPLPSSRFPRCAGAPLRPSFLKQDQRGLFPNCSSKLRGGIEIQFAKRVNFQFVLTGVAIHVHLGMRHDVQRDVTCFDRVHKVETGEGNHECIDK